MNQFVLTLSCDDRIGIVHAVSGFLVERSCNVIESAQYRDPDANRFFMRVAFEAAAGHSTETLRSEFASVCRRFGMSYVLRDASVKPRLLIMVSRHGHCLNDLLFRYRSGELAVEIPAVISNHQDFRSLVESYGIPFHHLPLTEQTRGEQEARVLDMVASQRIDLVVLARYMQILSDAMCRELDGRAINIHHSFLPSFKGANPYRQAFERGVKIIGATAHYVTADLDEGPIIEQDVARVDHVSSVADVIAVGRDVESVVLARAVKLHSAQRVLLNGPRTVVFR